MDIAGILQRTAGLAAKVALAVLAEAHLVLLLRLLPLEPLPRTEVAAPKMAGNFVGIGHQDHAAR